MSRRARPRACDRSAAEHTARPGPGPRPVGRRRIRPRRHLFRTGLPGRAARGGAPRLLVGLLRRPRRAARTGGGRPGDRSLLQFPPRHGRRGRCPGAGTSWRPRPCAGCGPSRRPRRSARCAASRPARRSWPPCRCCAGRWRPAAGRAGSWREPTGRSGRTSRPRWGPAGWARPGRPAPRCASTAGTGTWPPSWCTASAGWRRTCWPPGPRRSPWRCSATTGAGARTRGTAPWPR